VCHKDGMMWNKPKYLNIHNSYSLNAINILQNSMTEVNGAHNSNNSFCKATGRMLQSCDSASRHNFCLIKFEISGLKKNYTYLLTPWSRVLLEKLTSKL